MHAGLHALSWSFQRLGIVLGLVGLGVIIAYVLLVFVIVVVQAAAAFGQ